MLELATQYYHVRQQKLCYELTLDLQMPLDFCFKVRCDPAKLQSLHIRLATGLTDQHLALTSQWNH